MNILVLTIAAVLMLNLKVALAGPLEDGRAAYQRQEYAEAAKLFQRAATQGNAKAQNDLGIMYVNGQGVTRSYEKAVQWFRLAAAQGLSAAQYNLGMRYFLGQGVAQDYAEAARLFRLAAIQGNVLAQTNLGGMYANGQGVRQDHAEALKWLHAAAAQGFAPAQYNLGVMYAQGRGVQKDLGKAQKLLELAASQNFQGAARLLAKVRAQLAQTQKQDNTASAVNSPTDICSYPGTIRSIQELADQRLASGMAWYAGITIKVINETVVPGSVGGRTGNDGAVDCIARMVGKVVFLAPYTGNPVPASKLDGMFNHKTPKSALSDVEYSITPFGSHSKLTLVNLSLGSITSQ